MKRTFRLSSIVFSLFVVFSFVLSACGGSPAATTEAPAATSPSSGVITSTLPTVPTSAPATGPTITTTVSSTATVAATAPVTATTEVTATAAVSATSATSPTVAEGPGPQVKASGPAKDPTTMIESTISEPSSLDPAWAYDTASGEVIFNVYETLVFPKKTSVTDFVPMLATKWDVSSDGKTYTFTIRPNVKFHNGDTMTPEDVAYSLWRGMIQDRAGGPQWIMLQPFFGLNVQTFADDVVKTQFNNDWTKAAEAVEQAVTFDNSAGTVTMHLKQPFGPMIEVLGGSWAAVVDKKWVTSQGGWDGTPATAQKFHDPAAEKDELFDKMNGTGPYTFVRWQHGQEVDLAANPNYWLKDPLWQGEPTGAPKVQNVIIKYVSEWGTRFASFKAGDADLVYVDRQYYSQIDPLVGETCDANNNCTATNASNAQFRVYKGLPAASNAVIFFTQKVNTTGGNNFLGSGKLDGNGIPPDFFGDIHVRKAFNYCFDWDTYIKQVWNGEAIQNYGPIIQGELGYNPNQAHYSYDLDKCKSEFQASTLKSASGASLWDTGFAMTYIYNTGNDQRKSAGEILANGLQQVNPKFKMTVSSEPFAAELKDQVAGRLPIFMLGWLEDYHDPNDWVGPFLQSAGTYSGSQFFAADIQKQLDDLITQGVTATDTNKRVQIYGQLQNLAYENALDLFVTQAQVRQYVQLWVNGWYYNPIYSGIYFYVLSK